MKKNLLRLSLLSLTLILLTNCSSNDDGGEQDNSLNDAEYYITGNINGEPFRLTVDLDATESDYLISTSYALFNTTQANNCKYTYAPGIEPNLNESLPMASIIFQQLYSGGCDPQDETSVFNNLFPTGSDSYVQNESRGINIEYTPDYSGDAFYSSRNGNQTGSSLNISSTESHITPYLGDLFSFSQTVTGTFNCKVYNQLDPSDQLTITDGKFRLRVEAYNRSFMN